MAYIFEVSSFFVTHKGVELKEKKNIYKPYKSTTLITFREKKVQAIQLCMLSFVTTNQFGFIEQEKNFNVKFINILWYKIIESVPFVFFNICFQVISRLIYYIRSNNVLYRFINFFLNRILVKIQLNYFST